MLRAGGNAFDAAVAAGFTAAVVEPALTSLGGGGFLLARPPDGPVRLLDFFVDTPGRDAPSAGREPHFVPVTVVFPGHEQVFNTGRGSAAVPGMVAGLLHAHRLLGRLPLREVTAPAVHAARGGARLAEPQARFLGLLTPIVTLEPGVRALYAPEGRPLAAGTRLANPDLAAFLESLPDAAEDLYRGALARRIETDMREGAGLVGAADLAAYRVREREPLAARYRGRMLLTNPPPSFGGSLVGLSLELLERARPPVAPDAPERALAQLAVMQEVERRRDRVVSGLAFARGTTHVSVCDAEGGAASLTSSNGEGSGYLIPGTGIHLNNMLGEDDLHPEGFHAAPPGRRVASMMAPSLLLEQGRPRLVLGSGGSKRIRTALFQTAALAVDTDLPVDELVRHPRLHWDGEQLHLEPGLPEAVREALAARARLNPWPCRDMYFGGVHAAVPGEEAAGDPRRGGAARTVDLGA